MDGHSFGVVRHPQAREMPEVPYPGAALAEELDKRMLLQLRDDRKIIGTLRSFDQFANVLLEDAIERIYVGDQYADKPLGLQVVRGENVVLLGQIDPEREVPAGMTLVSEAEIMAAQKADKDFNKMAKTMRARMDFLDQE